MPVKEHEFNKSSLWPTSNNHWMAPGAVDSTAAQFGRGLDVGALRVKNGIWEILGTSGPFWIPFEPSNKVHYELASGFNRYGPGWSYGPGHNQHSEVINYFTEVYGREPSKMEQLDIEHNKKMYENLLSKYHEKIGFNPNKPVEPVKPTEPSKPVEPAKPIDPVKPVDPISTDTGLTLSSLDKRTQELLSLIPFRDMILPKFVIESAPRAIMELIKAKRRMEDRIVQRVIEGIKKG